jgi:hypothetical protein
MAIRINGVRASRLSEDKKEVIVAGVGKYVGELELRFAFECVDDLIVALTRAKADAPVAAAPDATAPVAHPTPSATNTVSQPRANDPPAGNNLDEVRFEIPRNCAITADTSGRGLVLFIVNHKLDRQAGYAFSPDAAKQLASGLMKSADTLLSSKAAATKS